MARLAAFPRPLPPVPGPIEDVHKLRYIDVARGVAIILVVFDHTSQHLSGLNSWLEDAARMGQMGVQLFFVASALTLCLSAAERGLATKAQVRNFYIRRFFRIAPLYYMGIAFYNARGFGHLPATTPGGDPGLHGRLLASVLFVHNLIPSATERVMPGGWSISAEMLFYVAFPLLFRVVTGQRRAAVFFALSLGFALAFQSVMCILAGQPIFVPNASFAYFLVINHLPVFACGFLLAYTSASRKPGLDFVTAFALLLTMAWFFCHSKFGLAFVLVPALAGLGFLFFVRVLATLRLNSIWAKAAAELGKKSFSIYVIHFFFAWECSHVWAQYLARHQVGPNSQLGLLFVASLLASYAAACVLEPLVEVRGVRLGKMLIARLSRPAASGV